jgi:proteic killer suppression protein
MIRSFRNRGLVAFWENGDGSKIRPDHIKRVRQRLTELDAAQKPDDLNVPGFNFHKLHGKPQRYAIAISGPWRITFAWEGNDAVLVDYEQHH